MSQPTPKPVDVTPVEIIKGTSPIILGMPHAGTWLPREIAGRLNTQGQVFADTDWHIDRLYDGLLPHATIVRANFHRYAIDANRDPHGTSLYPGQNTTELVPRTDFDGGAIWTNPPTEDDIARRLDAFHIPYHSALVHEIDRIRTRHGTAILYDCHSIRSVIPYLFDGKLPDFNIGTDSGKSCAPEIEMAVAEICRGASGYSVAVNGRFRGGWTTRHYGQPHAHCHAIQMELAQSTYLVEETLPFRYDPKKAEGLRQILAKILHRIEEIAYTLTDTTDKPM